MERTISVVTEKGRGVFSRISGLMERRGFAVQGVTAGSTHRPEHARYTFVISGDDRTAGQAVRQLRKMVETVSAEDLGESGYVERCMMLLKFCPPPGERTALFEAMKSFGCLVADDRGDSVIFEAMGTAAHLDACLDGVKSYGLVEAVKSGPLALGTR